MFYQGPKLLRAALPPCQRIAHTAFIEAFKTCAKHVPPKPQTPPCSFTPLPALCQVECPCLTGSKYYIHRGCQYRSTRAPNTRAPNPSVQLYPLASALPSRMPLPYQVEILHYRRFQYLREARSTSPPKPLRAALPLASALPGRMPLPYQVKILHL